MDDQELTVKDIVTLNKVRKVEDKLLLAIQEQRLELSKSEEYRGESNTILLTGTFNVLTAIVASDIDDGVFQGCIIECLIKDLKLEIARKLEILAKEKIKNS